MCSDEITAMAGFIKQHPRLVVLTGAGLSAASGIPTYRDASGKWLRREPIQHRQFIELNSERQRYWARSLLGWMLVSEARPNKAHKTLAEWEQLGRIELLISQNVDGLHRMAGSNNVLELHGRLDRVQCLNCYRFSHRSDIQQQLIELNLRLWQAVQSSSIDAGPDGDANVDDWDMSTVHCPTCPYCKQQSLKPDVVFFGGTVPKGRVDHCKSAIARADALLVIGSSLQVFSGYRFCKLAHEQGKAIAAINIGETRADPLLTTKLSLAAKPALQAITAALK